MIPQRQRLPDERASITHKFSIAGHEGYLTAGLYPDGRPGEIFIRMAKEGSFMSGMTDVWAMAVSFLLQYGVPLEVVCTKFRGQSFEPSGFTPNSDIGQCSSVVDYAAQWLMRKFPSRPEAELEARVKTAHQQRVEHFMKLARQVVPSAPTMPDEKTRRLRARLILEEALETVEALGFAVRLPGSEVNLTELAISEHQAYEPKLAEILDGCMDVSVVTTGTLSACGIADQSALELVDANNLAKFGPGHSFREDGKLIKPPNHQKPDFAALLVLQEQQASHTPS